MAGFEVHGKFKHLVFTTNAEGGFVCPLPPGVAFPHYYAYKKGWSLPPRLWSEAGRQGRVILRLLDQPRRWAGIIVDGTDKPLAGASVRIESLSLVSKGLVGLGHFLFPVLAGSPLEKHILTTTDREGMFSFATLPAHSWLRLAVTTADGRHMRVKQAGRTVHREGMAGMVQDMGYMPMETEQAVKLVAYPAARVQGRVTTKLPGVSVAGLRVFYQGSRPQPNTATSNDFGMALTNADGRFVFDDLDEGTINIFVRESSEDVITVPRPSEDVPWTHRAAQDVDLKSGWTRAVMIELIRGVEVEGTVVSSGQPFEGAELITYGPYRPRSGAFPRGAKIDARGRYRFRLPPGIASFVVSGSMGNPPSQSQTVTIPEGVTHFEVPPIEIASTVVSGGRVIDSANHPVANAEVVGVCQGGVCKPFSDPAIMTDAKGAFQLPPNTAISNSAETRIRIRLADGSVQDGVPNPGFVGTITVTLPR
ncbi:MAG: carboxypeptidase-like regulatory domain-containing protein [Isosphaeraceae bacterium]